MAETDSSYDYESDAAQIKEAAQTVVEEIEARLAAKPDDGKPLFVPFGESHIDATNGVLQILVMKMLKDRSHKIAVGLEDPYNALDVFLGVKNERVRAYFRRMDGDGSLRLKMLHAVNILPHQKMLPLFFLKDGIAPRFNDLARSPKSDFVLDIKDKFTEQTIIDTMKELGPALSSSGGDFDNPVEATSRSGMYSRNKSMLQNAVAHAKEEGASIYIQLSGAAHVNDNLTPFEHTLTGLAAGQDMPVIGIVTGQDGDAKTDAEKPLLHVPLPERVFCNPYEEKKCPEEKLEKERVWLTHVLPLTGLGALIENWAETEAAYGNEAYALFLAATAAETAGVPPASDIDTVMDLLLKGARKIAKDEIDDSFLQAPKPVHTSQFRPL